MVSYPIPSDSLRHVGGCPWLYTPLYQFVPKQNLMLCLVQTTEQYQCGLYYIDRRVEINEHPIEGSETKILGEESIAEEVIGKQPL
jgi:hypothetical protein